jgi:hypothetical protein
MTREQRTEFRRALQDELATLRCLVTSLRYEFHDAERDRLKKARAECLHLVRYYLRKLHPPAAPKAARRPSGRPRRP